MIKSSFFIFFGILFCLILGGCKKTPEAIQHAREEVIMRKIGHELLLDWNDSTSLIKPIVYDEDKYIIRFDANLSFSSNYLVEMIDSTIKKALPNNHYLVQVAACETGDVVYSYEVKQFLPITEVACKTREQPEACYEIIIQFIRKKEGQQMSNLLYVLIIALFFMGLASIYFKKKSTTKDGKIKIGAYLYDRKNMLLTKKEIRIELTGKESELLNLLCQSINDTVDRETILNKVWGDEGDYVGRTLDVYISKLRKKLENDASIQLKNIRGIGYKLIVKS